MFDAKNIELISLKKNYDFTTNLVSLLGVFYHTGLGIANGNFCQIPKSRDK
jgi:hypothetical protein